MVRDSVESLLGVDANARSQLPVVKPCQEIADRGSYTGYVSGVMAATGPAKAAVARRAAATVKRIAFISRERFARPGRR